MSEVCNTSFGLLEVLAHLRNHTILHVGGLLEPQMGNFAVLALSLWSFR